MSSARMPYMSALLVLTLLSIAFLSLTPQQEAKITVNGRALFDFGKYSGQRVKVVITEDGKTYKTVTSDDRGNFSAQIGVNHIYMFNLTMDYHGTSKVQINTRVPDIVAKEMTGAYFEFNCEMYERYQGLNMGLLNRPLIKMSYNAKKDRFEADKQYSKDMKIDMDNFLTRVNEKKSGNASVIKDDPKRNQKKKTATKTQAKSEEPQKERKVIEFEVEKEKVAENKRGSKNIMEYLEEEPEPVIIQEAEEAQEELALIEEEEIPEEKLAMNVVPKRILIEEKEEELQAQASVAKEIEMQKMKMREAQEMKRRDEESKIREQVRTLNRKTIAMREKQMKNRKIQTERIQGLIAMVSEIEIAEKRAAYQSKPSRSNEVLPSVVMQSNEGVWKDEEKVTVFYPDTKAQFRKISYVFGITYYYMNEEEVSEEVYCSNIEEFTKNTFPCAN